MAYWTVSFPGLAKHVSDVRRFTVASLGNAPGVDTVELVASELASNAIRHTYSGQHGGRFVLHLAAFGDRWRVRVDDDGSSIEPRPLASLPIESVNDVDQFGEEAEYGRGLALVVAVSSSWGVLGDCYSRAVWADIPRPAQPDGEAPHGRFSSTTRPPAVPAPARPEQEA